MIRQHFSIKHYWKVIVYHHVDYNFFHKIVEDLYNIDISSKTIEEAYKMMSSGKAKAVTISNLYLHRSVVLFNSHRSWYDYVNSLVHEAEHLKQAMLYAYDIDDSGEPPAYTVGYLAMRMFEVFKYIF